MTRLALAATSAPAWLIGSIILLAVMCGLQLTHHTY